MCRNAENRPSSYLYSLLLYINIVDCVLPQIVLLSHNLLNDVSSEVFRSLQSLRVIEIADNDIKLLPDNLFPEEGLEK